MKVSETALVRSILRYLAYQPGVFAWRNNSGAVVTDERFIRYGKRGSSDIIGICANGRFLAVEAKVGSGKQSPEQVEFERSVKAAGGLYVLAYSIDDVKKGLDV